MVINQRNTTVTPAGGEFYAVDRWAGNSTGSTRFSLQGSSVAPTGFTNSLLATTTTAGTPASSDFCYLIQYIEGFNIADFDFGTANAKTITLSFWTRSSLTGSFGGSLGNSAGNRRYMFSFTISSANTWEYKTITIAGDTTGTWLTDNGRGISVVFNMGTGSSNEGTAGSWTTSGIAPTGSVDLVGTSGATFYITGVQLEIGSTATPFERRLYNQELANCQRYCEVQGRIGTRSIAAFGFYETTTTVNCVLNYTQKRATPTVTVTNGGGSANSFASSQATSTINTVTAGSIQTNLCLIGGAVSSGTFTAGLAGYLEWRNVNAYALIEAEL
jgi:hypothetical protein